MDSIPQQILIQIILILLNAFFAGTEIALLSLNSGKLRKMQEEGDKKAGKLLKLVEQPAAFLSTIQIGITLAGFLGSAFAAENFSGYIVDWVINDLGFDAIPLKLLSTLSMVLVTIILAYFTLILGELVPKRIAMQKPYLFAKIACTPVSIIATVMRPVVWFLSLSTNTVLRILRLHTEAEEENVTEEEIRMMVELGGQKGTIDETEEEWIQNVFRFDDINIDTIMTRRADITMISDEEDADTIWDVFAETGYSRLPVYGEDEDDIVGILNAKAFLLNESEDEDKKKPWQKLLKTPYFVPDSLKADTLFQEMQHRKEHIALVVDEYGQVTGLVTLEDLLEEIVGNIYDEFDKAERPELEKVSENHWKVAGSLLLSKLEEELEVDIPEQMECETVAGLIYHQLNMIPKNGTCAIVIAYGLKFRVSKMRGPKIMEVIIEKVKETEEGEKREEGRESNEKGRE